MPVDLEVQCAGCETPALARLAESAVIGEGNAHGGDESVQGLHLLADFTRAKGSSIGIWQGGSRRKPAAS